MGVIHAMGMIRGEFRWWWRERRYWRGFRSSGVNLYDRILVRLNWIRLPWRGRHCKVWLRGHRQPFIIRMGTADARVLKQMLVHQEYERLTRMDLGSVRQIVDLGANCGFSVLYWRHVYPDATVLAVEPDPDNVRMLKKNLEKDGLPDVDQVRIAPCCVAATPRTVHLDIGGESWSYRMRDQPAGATSVAVDGRPLPDLLAEYQFKGEIDILKCDIEGAEQELFADCRAWAHRVRNLVVEVHAPYTVDALLTDLQRGGWRGHCIETQPAGPHTVVFLRRDASDATVTPA